MSQLKYNMTNALIWGVCLYYISRWASALHSIRPSGGLSKLFHSRMNDLTELYDLMEQCF